MYEAEGSLLLEVDLSGVMANRRDELARALTMAVGGSMGNISGLVADAEVRGDLLRFLVTLPEDMIAEAASGLGRSVIFEIAEEMDVHEDCHDEDDLTEAREEAIAEAMSAMRLAFEGAAVDAASLKDRDGALDLSIGLLQRLAIACGYLEDEKAIEIEPGNAIATLRAVK